MEKKIVHIYQYLKKFVLFNQILNENEKKNIIKRIAIIENEIEQIKKMTVP